VFGGVAVLAVAALLIAAFAPYPEIKFLPLYTLSTVIRIGFTLLISILWGVSFGILCATNKTASHIIVPIVDLLQSLPILGYFPMVISFLFAWGAFGIELAVIVLLFTSMAWSIFFGVVGAVRSISPNITEASRSFGVVGWPYVRHVVLPAIVPALISGGNLAWCDGWFFVIAAEYIQYQGVVIGPPSGGLGYLLAVAAFEHQDMALSVNLLLYITFIVIYFNTITWQRLMNRTTAEGFRPFLRTPLSSTGKFGFAKATQRLRLEGAHWSRPFTTAWQRLRKYSRVEKAIGTFAAIVVIMLIGYTLVVHLPTGALILQGLSEPPAAYLPYLPILVALTLGRLTVAYAIALVVAIGLGVMAAEHKRVAKVLYPIYDIGQGVPILALFPVIYLGLSGVFMSTEIALEVTCILMLVLDMIWYMFLNIMSAVKTIPSEIREVGQVFGFKGWRRIKHIVLPSIMPAIVTGSVLSWGTGWNTVIFAEYLQTKPPTFLPGIGSLMDQAGYLYGNTIILLLLLAIVAAIVLAMEGLVWRPLMRRHEKHEVVG
jgi:NitT/TauT family transport system permease protein